MANPEVTHISDTASWVAVYRAQESERADALFQDPLAGRLAGKRGQEIASAMPYPAVVSWIIVMRTIGIDTLIQRAISLGIDTLVNLGAGLDTRPYRMSLPPDLRWIEVDFPHVIRFKKGTLAAERPVCRLERIEADLSDIPLRRRLFEQIGTESRSTLILTEGVIPYLTTHQAQSLSEDLAAVPSFKFWIQDYRQGGTRSTQRWAPRKMRRILKDSPFRFEEPDWLSFFTRQGWTILENRLAANEGERVGRPFPFVFPWSLLLYVVPARTQRRWRTASGCVLYQRGNA